MLAEKFRGRPVGLNTLAAAVGEEPDTLEDVYEPFLLQLGLLMRTPKGRQVTERGYEHLGIAPPTTGPARAGCSDAEERTRRRPRVPPVWSRSQQRALSREEELDRALSQGALENCHRTRCAGFSASGTASSRWSTATAWSPRRGLAGDGSNGCVVGIMLAPLLFFALAYVLLWRTKYISPRAKVVVSVTRGGHRVRRLPALPRLSRCRKHHHRRPLGPHAAALGACRRQPDQAHGVRRALRPRIVVAALAGAGGCPRRAARSGVRRARYRVLDELRAVRRRRRRAAAGRRVHSLGGSARQR